MFAVFGSAKLRSRRARCSKEVVFDDSRVEPIEFFGQTLTPDTIELARGFDHRWGGILEAMAARPAPRQSETAR
jgi:hypothetical protein